MEILMVTRTAILMVIPMMKDSWKEIQMEILKRMVTAKEIQTGLQNSMGCMKETEKD